VVAGVVSNGADLRQKPSSFTFGENQLLIDLGGEKMERSYRFVNYLETPKTINLIDEEGNITRGICEFEGRTMKLCLQNPDSNQRPTAFESTPESKTTLLTLNRVPTPVTDYQRIQGTWQLVSDIVEEKDQGDIVPEVRDLSGDEQWTFRDAKVLKNNGTEKLDTSFYLDRYDKVISLIDEDWKITLGKYEFQGDTLRLRLSKTRSMSSSEESAPDSKTRLLTFKKVEPSDSGQ
jgi:uncharacterized protein (TIGR03067 family)